MRILILLCLVFALSSCKSRKKQQNDPSHMEYTSDWKPDFSDGPPLIIYKTTSNFSQLVPVTMNPEKSRIVAYPGPSDVLKGETPAFPTELKEGFWLDNLGIQANSVYLSMSLEEYSHMKEAPSLDKMMEMLEDKAPFEVIYFCGNRAKIEDPVAFANQVIKDGKLERCKCLTK